MQALKRRPRDGEEDDDEEDEEKPGRATKRQSIAAVVKDMTVLNADASGAKLEIDRERLQMERAEHQATAVFRKQEVDLRQKEVELRWKEVELRREEMESKERIFLAEVKERHENSIAQREAIRQQHDLLMRLLLDKLEKRE